MRGLGAVGIPKQRFLIRREQHAVSGAVYGIARFRLVSADIGIIEARQVAHIIPGQDQAVDPEGIQGFYIADIPDAPGKPQFFQIQAM